jgi:hypothetical protein
MNAHGHAAGHLPQVQLHHLCWCQRAARTDLDLQQLSLPQCFDRIARVRKEMNKLVPDTDRKVCHYGADVVHLDQLLDHEREHLHHITVSQPC